MFMSVLAGKVAQFDNFKKYFPAEGDKSALTTMLINVQGARKDKETGFPKNLLIKVIAYGYLAEKLNNFEQGEYIVLKGNMDEEEFVGSDETVKKNFILLVDSIDNTPNAGNPTFSSDNKSVVKEKNATSTLPKPGQIPPKASKAPSLKAKKPTINVKK